MKTIGILGGMSAASTQLYYRELGTLPRAAMGGLHSPELLIRSLDFAVIEALQAEDRWEEAGERLNQEALALERGGAEILGLATNTMHKVAETMMRGVSVPLVHIADATASRISDLQRSPPYAPICGKIGRCHHGDNSLVCNVGCAMSVAQCAGWVGILRVSVETVAWRALEPGLFLLDRAKLISVG